MRLAVFPRVEVSRHSSFLDGQPIVEPDVGGLYEMTPARRATGVSGTIDERLPRRIGVDEWARATRSFISGRPSDMV